MEALAKPMPVGRGTGILPVFIGQDFRSAKGSARDSLAAS